MPRPRKRKRPTKPKPQQPHREEQNSRPPRRWRLSLRGFVTAVATAIGIAAGVVVFLPRVTVAPGGPIDPSRPSPIPFTIVNSGNIPLTEVQGGIGICEYDMNSAPHDLPERCHGPLSSLLAMPRWYAPILYPDEPLTVDVDDMLHPDKLGAADISIAVGYYPWFLKFWPFHGTKQYRFQTKVEPDGKLWWRARPVEN